MDSFGFIRGPFEIKILLLFILNRLPAPVEKDTLYDISTCDQGFNYFEFSEALANLVETEHVKLEDDKYSVTEKGKRNGNITESSVPYSVRLKAERRILPVAQLLKRSSMIKVESNENKNGGYTVHLALSDGTGSILSMDVLVGSSKQSEVMEKNFLKNAEDIYAKIVDILIKSSDI